MLHLSGRVCLGVALICSCLYLLVGVPAAYGQLTSVGTLNVIVSDQSGGVVEGATTELRSASTNKVWTLQTQGLGTAVFTAVPLGTYRLTVAKPNFKSEVVETVVIEGGRVTDLKVTLRWEQPAKPSKYHPALFH